MQRINGRKARDYTSDRRDFQNSSGTLYGTTQPNGDYIVYSYGRHFPLYLYRNGQWFGNSDRYSNTTSHHRTYAQPFAPSGRPIQWMTTEQLQSLINKQDAGPDPDDTEHPELDNPNANFGLTDLDPAWD